jgi:hypothetical protein
MRKLLLTAAVLFTVTAVARSEQRSYVFSSTWTMNSLVSGGGVGYSTITLPGNVGVSLGNELDAGIPGVFTGIQFSTGTTADFVDVWDSTSADAGRTSSAFVRVYNVATSSGGVGAYSAGFSGPKEPMRFSKGLIIRPSRADFNFLGVLFNLDK